MKSNTEMQDRGERMPLAEQKALMRQRILKKRDSMPKSMRERLSLVICESLILELDAAESDSSIAVYSPMKSEVNISRYIERLYAEGLSVAFPCMNEHGCTPQMSMRIVPEKDWKEGTCPFIKNPIRRFKSNDSELKGFPILPPERLSTIIVPLVAFDNAFRRLGYGGGNYDEYLSLISSETKVIGVAYETQRVQSVIVEEHDLALPLIISA